MGKLHIYTTLEERMDQDINIELGRRDKLKRKALIEGRPEPKFDDIDIQKDMYLTRDFLKGKNLAGQMIYTIMKMIASNTAGLAYFFMVLCMYRNASILSVVYPLAVFGYALIQETRPS